METILEIVGRILAAAVVGAIFYILPKVESWLTQKAGRDAADYIMTVVREFVKAADQLYKEEDKTGAIRNAYVREQLTNLGIAVDGEIEALIEAAVLDLK